MCTVQETIVAKDNKHLRELIREHIEKYGELCDLKHIDVTNVKNMSNLFFNSKFNCDVSNWNVSNVTDMEWMFAHSKFNKNISNWNINDNCDFHNICYDTNIPKDGIMFWYSALNGEIKDMDHIRAAHMGKLKPILESLELHGIRAAKYLHHTFTNSNLDLTIHNIAL